MNQIKEKGHSLVLDIIGCGLPALFRLIRKRIRARKARRNAK